MKTLIKNEFRQTRKTLLIWLGIMLLLCGFCYFELLSLKDSLDEMARTVGQFPRLIMIMFGVKGDLTTALGWYACIYFWEGLLAFAYAISLGLSCVAREKKFGTSEYLFTKPVERKTIVLAKVIVSAVNLLVFALFSGVCNYFTIVLPLGGLDQPGAVLSTTMGMFFTQLLFFALGLLFASLFKSYKAAVRAGTVFVLAAYVLAFTAEYTGNRFLDYLTPLRYYDVYEVALNGVYLSYIVLLGTCCIMRIVAFMRYCLRKTVIFGWGKSGLADLAQHLRFALSIVPLEIVSRRVANGAVTGLWNIAFSVPEHRLDDFVISSQFP